MMAQFCSHKTWLSIGNSKIFLTHQLNFPGIYQWDSSTQNESKFNNLWSGILLVIPIQILDYTECG